MKNIVSFFFVGVAILCLSCSGQKKAGAGRPGKTNELDSLTKDSVEFYETEFEVRQKNYKEKLTGKWDIKTMRRQQKAELENLNGIYIELSADSVFTGNAGCNRIRGIYILKGTSIKFTNIISTKMACDKIEQEGWILKLLENTVSAYSVTSNQLLLRDGSSNIVFECTKLN